MDSYFNGWRKFATFSGRSTRTEYFSFVLINWGISILLGVGDIVIWAVLFSDISDAPDFACLFSLWQLAVFIPTWAVTVRRLHDADHTGWNILFLMIPMVGWLILLIMLVEPSDDGPNTYGPSSKVFASYMPSRVSSSMMPSGWYCPNGHFAPIGSTFCPVCGATIDNSPPRT